MDHSTTFNPNKLLKEEFVTDLTGSSFAEIQTQLTTIIVMGQLRRLATFNFSTFKTDSSDGPRNSAKENFHSSNFNNFGCYFREMILDFAFIVLPNILFFTVLSEWISTFAILSTSTLAFVSFKRLLFSGSPGCFLPIRMHLSYYRVYLMIITCICILAVDFKIFPRRFAKTEMYGTSVMDAGVGSFVITNALVSRKARNIESSWFSEICSTLPLIILGFGRIIFTTSVDYQVHVGEYGVHWNFFLTLAVVQILTAVVNIPARYCGAVGSLILLGYEVCLLGGLNSYMLSKGRANDILSQNKEGIFSIFGYWGMHLVGIQLGNYLFFRSKDKDMDSSLTLLRALVITLIFWILTLFLNANIERVSRRMCNLPYVTYMLAMNLQLITTMILLDFVPGSKPIVAVEALSQNLLPLFLLANVLTGLINITVDTYSASPSTALAILFIYAASLFFLVGLSHFNGVRLKFW